MLHVAIPLWILVAIALWHVSGALRARRRQIRPSRVLLYLPPPPLPPRKRIPWPLSAVIYGVACLAALDMGSTIIGH